jgi:hypothetical protein
VVATTQISAHISLATKDRLERFVRANGVTRAHVIEQALLHHLQALEELPDDVVIPGRVVLSADSARMVHDLVTHPPAPTGKMQQLFSDR